MRKIYFSSVYASTTSTKTRYNMHSRVWLAYAITFLPETSPLILRARKDTKSSTTSPLRLISLGNVSTPPSEAALDPSDGRYLKPPISHNATQPPWNHSSLYDESFENYLNISTVFSPVPMCDDRLGVNLNRASCFSAWENTGLSTARARWGERGTDRHYDYKLPTRFSSGKSAQRYR